MVIYANYSHEGLLRVQRDILFGPSGIFVDALRKIVIPNPHDRVIKNMTVNILLMICLSW